MTIDHVPPAVPAAAPAAVPAGHDAAQGFDGESRSLRRVIVRRFLRHRLAVVGLVLFVGLVLVAFVGGWLWKHDYRTLDFPRYAPPSADHPLGTDRLGADMLSQVIRGLQFSLRIALVATAVATVIGVVLGALAGYLRGWVDSLISRFIDLLLVVPSLVVVVVLVRSTFVTDPERNSSNWLMVALFLASVAWLPTARLIRGCVLSLREKEFVEAARAMGGSTFHIVFRHILANTVDVIIVNVTLSVAVTVIIEAGISFIGLGVQSPDTSLGLLVSQNRNELTLHPWLFFVPFGVIVLLSLAINFMGDGLRDALDPRQVRVRG